VKGESFQHRKRDEQTYLWGRGRIGKHSCITENRTILIQQPKKTKGLPRYCFSIRWGRDRVKGLQFEAFSFAELREEMKAFTTHKKGLKVQQKEEKKKHLKIKILVKGRQPIYLVRRKENFASGGTTGERKKEIFLYKNLL